MKPSRQRLLPSLGHDNHRRLSKLYAWEEKKSKTSWGAETVDYEKIATAAVQAMKAADLNRFLVSDLYCPGYNPRQSLEKNSNLARTSASCKIDLAKVGASARGELTRVKQTKAEQKRETSPHIQLPHRESSKAKTDK